MNLLGNVELMDTYEDEESPKKTSKKQQNNRYVSADLLSSTVWFNPSDQTVKMDILTNRQTGVKRSGYAFVQVTIPPGAKVQLPSEYNEAIRTTGKNGVVVGGLCPWLLKDGETNVKMDPSLKAHEEIEKEELAELAKKIQESRDLAEAKAVKAELKKAGRPKKEIEE